MNVQQFILPNDFVKKRKRILCNSIYNQNLVKCLELKQMSAAHQYQSAPFTTGIHTHTDLERKINTHNFHF